MICPNELHQRSPNAPKFEGRPQEETEWQEQGIREAAWRLTKSVLKFEEQNKAVFFSSSEHKCLSASNLKTENFFWPPERQQGLEWCWNGFLDEIVLSCDSHNSQWRSADAWRGYIVGQRIGYILDYESSRKHASSFIAWKAFYLRWKQIFFWVDQRSRTTSH